jgi:glycosyltransferase involved in cell wall biosynthesis
MSTARIAQVTAHYPPWLGGVERVVQTTSELLADAGWEVEVFTGENGRGAGTVTTRPRLRVNYLRSFVIANVPIMPSLFFKLVKLPRGSIIHLHVAQAYTPEVVFLASKLKNIPYVAHLAIELEPGSRLGMLLPAYKRLILGPILRRAAIVTCQTEDWQSHLIRQYGVEMRKTVLLPNATDFTVASKPKHAISSVPRLLFVGRLTKQKNVPMLLQAIAMYRRTFDEEVALEIVGAGEDENDLRKQIETLDLNLVTLRGKLSGQELQAAYERSDIFVLPTLYETFGLVLIEAMAKGLPIVTTNVDSVRTVVVNGRNGLLTDVDPAAFCAAMRKLVTSPKLYETISANNLEDVEQYSWDHFLRRTQQIYSELRLPSPGLC